MATKTPGAERVARRAKQTANKAQADAQALVVPPTKEAKKAAAEAKPIARFGGDPKPANIRKTAQAKNKAQADKQAVETAASAPDVGAILSGVKPGETPTLRQLRQLAKATQAPMLDEAHEIAREAGRFVKDRLIGRGGAAPRAVLRHRRIEQSQRQLATANATR